MSHLAIALDQLIHEHGKNGADLARITGLTPAQISRWKNGVQTSIKPTCLKKLAAGLSPDPQVHSRLLFAHLQDECSGPGAAQIAITLQGPVSKPAKPSTKPKPILAPSAASDMEIISRHISDDANVRELVKSIAKLCRRKT